MHFCFFVFFNYFDVHVTVVLLFILLLFIFLCYSAQIVLDFKSFFFPFYSFYLKNDLFSLFYSGPFMSNLC